MPEYFEVANFTSIKNGEIFHITPPKQKKAKKSEGDTTIFAISQATESVHKAGKILPR